MEFENMLNKPLEIVKLSDDKERITFKFKDGFERAFYVAGDCCSHSWIEHLEMPDSVDGAVILSVGESDGVPWDGHECKKKKDDKWSNECGHDHLQVYNTRFRTNKGDIVLEYRNDSNGYYGGSLEDA